MFVHRLCLGDCDHRPRLLLHLGDLLHRESPLLDAFQLCLRHHEGLLSIVVVPVERFETLFPGVDFLILAIFLLCSGRSRAFQFIASFRFQCSAPEFAY